MNHDLENLRKKIDLVDQKLIKALAERVKLVVKVGKIKKANNLPVLDQKRWQEVLETRLKLAQSKGLSQKFFKQIFDILHKYSLEMEQK